MALWLIAVISCLGDSNGDLGVFGFLGNLLACFAQRATSSDAETNRPMPVARGMREKLSPTWMIAIGRTILGS